MRKSMSEMILNRLRLESNNEEERLAIAVVTD
jgi:hypothetical protein